MGSLLALDCKVPVHKLTGALGTAGNPTGLMVAKPLVLSEVQKRLEQEKLEGMLKARHRIFTKLFLLNETFAGSFFVLK